MENKARGAIPDNQYLIWKIRLGGQYRIINTGSENKAREAIPDNQYLIWKIRLGGQYRIINT